MVLNKVTRGLLGGYGDQRNPLVRRFEPYDLRLFWLSLVLMASGIAFSLLSLGFLFLFGGLAAGPQEAKCPKNPSVSYNGLMSPKCLTLRTSVPQHVQ